MNATRKAKALACELLEGTNRSERDPTAVRRRLWLAGVIDDIEQTETRLAEVRRVRDSRAMDR